MGRHAEHGIALADPDRPEAAGPFIDVREQMTMNRLDMRRVEFSRDRALGKFNQASRDYVGFGPVERSLIGDAQQIEQHARAGVCVGIARGIVSQREVLGASVTGFRLRDHRFDGHLSLAPSVQIRAQIR